MSRYGPSGAFEPDYVSPETSWIAVASVAGGPGATPLFLVAEKAVSLGIPLLPRHSTFGATAGATALHNFVFVNC